MIVPPQCLRHYWDKDMYLSASIFPDNADASGVGNRHNRTSIVDGARF